MAKTDHLFMPQDHMDELYNSKNPLVRFVHRNRIHSILAFVKNKKLLVCDAGCGEGHLIEKMHEFYPDNNYVGFDVSEVALQRARKRCPYATIEKKDLTQINMPNNSFDIIICSEVLEHIYEYQQVMKEFRRLIKQNGKIIITVPHELLWTFSRLLLLRRPIKVPDHVNNFTPKKIKKSMGIKCIHQKNLPFSLPWQLSLGYLFVFKK